MVAFLGKLRIQPGVWVEGANMVLWYPQQVLCVCVVVKATLAFRLITGNHHLHPLRGDVQTGMMPHTVYCSLSLP